MILEHEPDASDPCSSPGAPCRHFRLRNMLVRATASAVDYPAHVGALSIKCTFGGPEIYETSGRRFRVDDGSYLILNSGQTYSSRIESATPVRSVCVFFRDGFVEEVLGNLVTPQDRLLDDPRAARAAPLGFFEKTYPHDERLSPLLRHLAAAMDEPHSSNIGIDERFHAFAAGLLEVHRGVLHEVAQVPAVKASTRVELYRRIGRAREFIDASWAGPLDLQQIAGVACLSPHHFLRLFRRIFGITPHQYVTARKIEAARAALLRTDRSVTEICFSLGFESPSSFSLLFRRHSGLSPQQFRQREQRLDQRLKDAS